MDRKIYKKKPSACNCLNLRRASQAITQIYDEFLEPSGLKISQYSLLKHIKYMEPVSVSDLALEIRLDRTTLVRNLKSMEERGFIIDISASGARNRQLTLTDSGLETLEKAEQLWSEAQDYIDNYLGKDYMETLTVLLSKIEALVP
ncbi:transcriptional regulator, MarR family [Clostridiales bacterium oral taxon 876 str. F0540]|nr:transcriptional regulator, MarR family [Clostridiales bacterium oral taxon 876 str. F0540]